MKSKIVKLLPLCLLCWIFFTGCQAAFSENFTQSFPYPLESPPGSAFPAGAGPGGGGLPRRRLHIHSPEAAGPGAGAKPAGAGGRRENFSPQVLTAQGEHSILMGEIHDTTAQRSRRGKQVRNLCSAATVTAPGAPEPGRRPAATAPRRAPRPPEAHGLARALQAPGRAVFLRKSETG